MIEHLIFTRWALFPPHTPKELLKVPTSISGHQHDEAIAWFAMVYPKTQLPSWPKDCKGVSNCRIVNR